MKSKNIFKLIAIFIAVVSTLGVGLFTILNGDPSDTPKDPAIEVKNYYARRAVSEEDYIDYQSIAAAIEAAENGEEIEILKNVALSEVVEVSKEITLFANAANVLITRAATYNAEMFNVSEDGNLTIGKTGALGTLILDGDNRQSATASLVISKGIFTLAENAKMIKSKADVSGVAVFVEEGEFMLSGGIIENNSAKTALNLGAVYVMSNASATINSGLIQTTSFVGDFAGIYLENQASLVINGGTINIAGKIAVGYEFSGDSTVFTMNNGNIGNIRGNGGSIIVNGGIIADIKTDTTDIEINGGTITKLSTYLVTSGTPFDVFANGGVISQIDVYPNVNLQLTENGYVGLATYKTANSVITVKEALTTNNPISILPFNYDLGKVLVNFDNVQDINLTKFTLVNAVTNNAELISHQSAIKIGTTYAFEVTLSQDEYVYLGNEYSPVVTVKINGVTLQNNTHYTLSGDLSATDEGNYEITVQGVGLYSNKQGSAEWRILPQPDTISIELIESEYIYTGSEIIPNYQVKLGSIVIDTDFVVTQGGNGINVGTYTLIVEGLSTLEGQSDSVTWYINATTEDFDISLNSYVFEYTASLITPVLTIMFNGEIVDSENYIISGTQSATSIGDYTLTITGVGNFNNQATINWSIVENTSSFDIEVGQGTFVYDGTLKTPTITVRLGGITLVKDVDYTLSGDLNAINAGNYAINVAGIGSYSANGIANWVINPNSSNIVITLQQNSFNYIAAVITPVITSVRVGGVDLVQGTDYSITGDLSGTNVNNYTINATGNNNYSGTGSVIWEITRNSLDLVIELDSYSFEYTGSLITPVVTVKDSNGNILTQTTDYVLGGNLSRTVIDDYIITASGRGNYSGNGSVDWSIVVNTQELTVLISPASKEYTGEELTPNSIVVSLGAVTLQNNVDYTLSGQVAGTNVGVYTVTATGIGNYSGIGNSNWEITANTEDFVFDFSDDTFIYNGLDQKPNVVVRTQSGTVLTENIDYTLTMPETSIVVGSYGITATGINGYTAVANAYYAINARPVTVLWDNLNAVYDGDAHVPEISSTSFIIGDDVGFVILTSYINAGTYDYTAVLTGEDSSNYAINTGLTAQLQISQKSVTVLWADLSVVYDGNSHAPDISTNDFILGDDVGFVLLTSHTDAGTYDYTAVLTGEDSINYVIDSGLTTQLEISQKSVVIIWTPEVASYIYDGEEHGPDIDDVQGILVGDVSDVTAVASNNKNSEVDSYIATVTLTGEKAGNYVITSGQTKNYEITTTLLSSFEVQTTTYNGTSQNATILNVYPMGATYQIISGSVAINAGEYTVTIEGTGNYSGQIQATWTINKFDITATWNPSGEAEFDYDGASHGVSVSNINGVFAGDVADVTYLLTNNTAINAGNYTATLTLQGAKSSNYNLTNNEKEFIINKGIIEQSEIDFEGYSAVYNSAQHGFNPDLGSYAGSTISSYSTDAREFNPNGSYTASTIVTTAVFTQAGRYVVTVFINGGINYENTSFTETLDITRRPITLTADDQISDYGAALATLTYYVSSGSLVGSDNLTSSITITTDATPSSLPGDYDIEISTSGHKNYIISTGTGVYTIEGVSPDIEFTGSGYNVQQGNTISVTATTNSGGAITYSMSPSIAFVNSSTGLVSTSFYNSSAYGTVTITATVAAHQGYSQASTTTELLIIQTVARVGSSLYSTLQSAYNATAPGGTLEIMGTFTMSSSLYVDKNINIRSGKYEEYEDTITRAPGFTGPFFDIHRSTVTFGDTAQYGMLIFDGNNVNNADSIIKMNEIFVGTQSVTIREKVVFKNNRTSGNGGVINNIDGNTLNILGGEFINNRSGANGGAVYGLVTGLSDATFTNNFANNNGGAWYGTSTSITMTGLNFSGNEAYYDGGAIYRSNTSTALTISSSTFQNNTSLGGGHVLYALGTGTITLQTVTMSSNEGYVQEQASDGVIYVNASNLVITSGTYSSNYSWGGYGAFLVNNTGTVTINGGTFSSNLGYTAGLIVNLSSSTVTINGGTFTNNTVYSGTAYLIVNNGILAIRGGSFSGNTNTATNGATSTLYISGTPTISNPIHLANTIYVRVDNTLGTLSTPIQLTLTNTTNGTNVVYRTNSAYSISGKFTLTNAGKTLTAVGDYLRVA